MRYSPLDIKRLAVRIEGLMHTRTHGWAPGDEMDFRNHMPPRGRARNRLPSPEELREMADSGEQPKLSQWQTWIGAAMRMEGLVRDNDPRNPKRMMRDMARGKFPRRARMDKTAPTNVVKTPADEEKWKKAKARAKEQGKAENYAYIMGIYKSMNPERFKSAQRVAARYAALPKIPGVSARKLAEMVAEAKEYIVLGLTDSYGGHGEHGEEWGSDWKATELGRPVIYRSGERGHYEVAEATFISAQNSGSVEVHVEYGRRLTPETRLAVTSAVAKAVRGTWPAKAWFGWIGEDATVERVGEVFESTGDARPFYRAGVEGAIKHFDGVEGGEYPVTMRVSSVSVRKDGSLRVKASLSA